MKERKNMGFGNLVSFTSLVCVLLLAMMPSVALAATVWDVHDTAQLLNAVTNAGEGDTIFAHNGIYTYTNHYPLFLSAPNITLRGESKDGVIYHDTSHFLSIGKKGNASGYVDSPAPGCIIEDFTVTHSGSNTSTRGITMYPNSPGGTVRNVVFENLGYKPLDVEASDWVIENCVFDGNDYYVDLWGDNTTFKNNIVTNAQNEYLAVLVGGNTTIVNNNTIKDSIYGAGISLEGASAINCIVTRNNLISNAYAGIELYGAGSGNKIYLNNFIDNGMTATTSGESAPAVTYWNSTEEIEYIYGGTTYTNYLGNYWGSDYTGVDADGDGIGDTPYVLPDGLGSDYYPLIVPFEQIPEPATMGLFALGGLALLRRRRKA